MKNYHVLQGHLFVPKQLIVLITQPNIEDQENNNLIIEYLQNEQLCLEHIIAFRKYDSIISIISPFSCNHLVACCSSTQSRN